MLFDQYYWQTRPHVRAKVSLTLAKTPNCETFGLSRASCTSKGAGVGRTENAPWKGFAEISVSTNPDSWKTKGKGTYAPPVGANPLEDLWLQATNLKLSWGKVSDKFFLFALSLPQGSELQEDLLFLAEIARTLQKEWLAVPHPTKKFTS